MKDRLVGRTTFDAEEIRIGRGAENELQIDNLALSRYHAGIERIEGVHFIKDFSSQNGTFVNGEKVPGRRALNDGDRIGLGKFVVLFRCQPAPAETEAQGIPLRNDAGFVAAGETLVSKVAAAEARERACPHVGYLAPRPQGARVVSHAIGRDVFVIGSSATCDLSIESAPPRALAILRGWRGFSLLALAPGAKRNGEAIDLRAELADGDALDLYGRTFTFRTGTPEAGP